MTAPDDAVPTVAVLGLGEAGGEISRDLLAAGVRVRGYDPVVRPGAGLVACSGEAEAASGAALVLSVNSAKAAEESSSHPRPPPASRSPHRPRKGAGPELDDHQTAVTLRNIVHIMGNCTL